ncbi:ABC transporter substrate-binding protein [Sulfurovum sp. ST-21]|uniref:ABC transporter substrate-binding protein n=1 Tax=Sulfurovum indicum TaxID=2779528 RepID=A0A7M1S5N9_9BACT|nr:helical backbone metal receptor [Sulfurovum indicum]QOR62646.1 ABC transporter substrate-binding protein [Sulfurovum indicum]
MKFWMVLLSLAFSAFAQERIVTLSPAINEIVYALGAGNQVVGNTTYATYPEASGSVPKVGGYFSPDLEKIIALRPTLVIMQQNNAKLAQKLQKLGIRTRIIRIDRLPHITEAVLALGRVLQKEERANNIVADIDRALKETKGIVSDRKILIVIGHNTQLVKQIFVAGQNLYLDDIINASGNTNALHSNRKGQPILNRENIIAANPDIVILLAHGMKARGVTKQELIDPWLKLPVTAARNRDIYIIDKEYAGIPSDRLVLFLNDFKAILHAAADQ